MKPTVVILILLFYSCSTDQKTDSNTVANQTNIATLIEITTNKDSIPSDPIPLTIIPGQGVNNIQLGTSNYIDILDFKMQFTVDSGAGIACGDENSYNWFWKRYFNESSGLLIEYSSEYFPELNTPQTYTRTLTKITVSENKVASLKNGLRIGTSTYLDVAKIYGPIPKDWKNESYLRFDKKGISFRFDSNSRISEIEIFKPN